MKQPLEHELCKVFNDWTNRECLSLINEELYIYCCTELTQIQTLIPDVRCFLLCWCAFVLINN